MDQRQHRPDHHALLRGVAALPRVLQLSVGDRFVVREVLGTDERGATYVAEQRGLGRAVALRVVAADDPRLTRLQAAATAQAGLEHPAILRVLECREGPAGLLVATELWRGGTLADVAPGSTQARAALRDIAVALDVAHARGVAHGDLRADLVLLRPGGAVVDGFAEHDGTPAGDREALCALVAALLPGSDVEAARRETSAVGTVARATVALDRRRRGRRVAAGVVAIAVPAAVVGAVTFAPAGARLAPAAAAPARGVVILGSDLRARDRIHTVGCGPRGAWALCTIAQHVLDGRALRAPRDGAIVGWTVRAASGPIALVVARRTAPGTWVLAARSQFVLARRGAATRHRVRLPVHAGDRVGIEVNSDAGVGVRARPGATTDRWFDRLGGSPRKPTLGPGTGLDGELQLRVELRPGPVPMPRTIRGAAAARLPPGRALATFIDVVDGGAVRRAVLVRVGDAVAVDMFAGARRLARIVVPDAVAAGRLSAFEHPGTPGALQVRWLNPGEPLPLEHSFRMRTATIVQTD